MKTPAKILAALTILPLTAAGLSGCASATDSTEETCAKVSQWVSSSNTATSNAVNAYDLKAQLERSGDAIKSIGESSKDSTLNSDLVKLGDLYRSASKNISEDASLKGLDPFSSTDKTDLSKISTNVQSKCGSFSSAS